MTEATDDIDPVSVSTALAKLIPEEDSQTLPIACRFVPQDQWLVSHIDTAWKIKDIKHWILSKCNAWGAAVPQPPRFRPASPVTFAASRRSSMESSSHGDTDDGEDDWDVFAYNDIKDVRSEGPATGGYSAGRTSFNSSEGIHPPLVPESVTQKYALYSFSCGHLLEDEASLSWYNLRPFELLEMHRMNGVVPIPRNSLLSYIEPYFEAAVMVSEGATSRKSRKARNGRISEDRNAAWLVRWAYIRDGVLNLCKDRSCFPTHKFPIHALCAIRGPEVLQAQPGVNNFVVCAKFRLPAPTPMAPDEYMRHQWHQHEGVKHKPPRMSTWVVLDMLEANSYDNFLRVLHRLAPCVIQTSFVPTVSVPETPLPSPADATSAPDAANFVGFGVRYPDWRIALVERARKAGLGDVGPAMAHYLYGTDDGQHENHALRRQASTLSGLRFNTRPKAEKSGRMSLDGSVSMPDSMAWLGEEDDEEEDADDIDSEVEWEGWVRDASRRAQEHRATLSLPTPCPSPGPRPVSPNPHDSSTSTLPSNELSSSSMSPSSPTSASSHSSDGSPSESRTRTLSFAPDPRKVITSAFVTVGGTMRTRSRSSTVTAATATASRSGAGATTSYVTAVASTSTRQRIEREPMPINTNIPSVRSDGRRQSLSMRVAFSPPSSSSPLSASASASASASGSSDRTTPSTSGLPSPTISGVKRIVKGVNIRNAFSSDKLVKGLEDALDFVDGK